MTPPISLHRRACAIAAAVLLLAGAGAALRLGASGYAAEAPAIAQITLSMTPAATISPLIYGVNYDWDMIPAAEFPRYAAAMREVSHYTLARFPSGWNAEGYDWQDNRLVAYYFAPWRTHAKDPGADPDTLLAAVPAASFISPSVEAVKDRSRVAEVAQRTLDLVRRYGNRVRIWEIGNEWWLQRGGRGHPDIRKENLADYAALTAAVAPGIKAIDPALQVYVNADWIEPQEVATMRQLVGSAAWEAVDGVAIHIYCGNQPGERSCERTGERVAAVRSAAGKDKIYNSEWAVPKSLSHDDFGIRNASATILALEDMALANVTAAAYWPPVKILPEISFMSADYKRPFATGLAFGWMSQYYRGQALRTTGDLHAAAARNDQGVTVIIPTEESGPRTVRIALAGTGLSQVTSAAALYSETPNDPEGSRVAGEAALPVAVTRGATGETWAEFTVDPGGPGRGASWEIARVGLR